MIVPVMLILYCKSSIRLNASVRLVSAHLLLVFLISYLGYIMHFVFLSVSVGTTKRKELHGTARARALSGSWHKKLDGLVFYAYKIDFVCNIVGEQYSNYVLLIESKLDDDVGNIEVDLYLVSKFVKSSISSRGQLQLDAEQVEA